MLDIHEYSHTKIILLEDFPLPHLSLLSKVSKGEIGSIKCSEALKKYGKISEDICLLFDEMYLQKRRKYFGGEMICFEENLELYKGIGSFITVGLKEFIPCVIESSPNIKINVAWHRDELFDWLDVLYRCNFHLHSIACDNIQ